MVSYADILTSLENLNVIELEVIRDVIDNLWPRRKMVKKVYAEPDFRSEYRRAIKRALEHLASDQLERKMTANKGRKKNPR